MNNTIKPEETQVINCSKCGQEKPLNNKFFDKNKSSPSGFRKDCKDCRNQVRKKQRIEKGHKIRAKEKERYYRNHEANIEYKRNYYRKNTEYCRKRERGYYQNNTEREAKRKKKFYEENRELVLGRCKKYRDNNKEKVLQRGKDYYHRNKDKVLKRTKEYRKENPDLYKVIQQRRKARLARVENTFTKQEWKKAQEHFNYKCAYCGKSCDLSQDHFIPVSKGGEYTINNIIPACLSCNSHKHNADFFDWYPDFKHYSSKREKTILGYLGYGKDKTQQLSIL